MPSACGFAFASAAGRELPALRRPLRALATAIAYSRVHTGLQPPGEALVGALAGTAIGRLVVGGVDGGGAAFLAARG